ncbi:MAG: sigma-70 family RNA polymerase sigma factor [Lentisphaeraceae bacterium]|nr:sigma-70 family RNA polymerase sigma factor [Lentisphaeraceae bacterium]
MADTHSTRETLIQRLSNCYDEQSWEEFVRYYRGFIFAVVHRSGLSYEDSQDVTQDVVVRAWKALPQFEYRKGECKFRSWLMTVCRNCMFDYAKSKRGRLEKLRVDVSVDVLTLCGSSAAEIDVIAEVEWKKHIAELALESVIEDFSETVLQTFYLHAEELSVREISERLGISENNVHVYRARVRKALMKEIFRLENQLNG